MLITQAQIRVDNCKHKPTNMEAKSIHTFPLGPLFTVHSTIYLMEWQLCLQKPCN